MSVLFRRCVWPFVVAALTGATGLAAADDAPAATALDQAAAAAQQAAAAPPAAATGVGGGTALYRVDGNHVDAHTMQGWRTWRAMACERCHGANQEGLVGPSLVQDLKTMSKDDFKKCVLEGHVEQGMPNFGGVKSVADHIDDLYAFLKGRSDGAIPPGHLKEIQ